MRYIPQAAVPLLIAFLLGMNGVMAQGQKISGIINSYAQVLSIDTTDVKTKIHVADKNGFKIGDKLLVIQMKGAVIDSSNNANFGRIKNFNSAGKYEFATLSFISGNILILSDKLTNSYQTDG